jgi:hypothetical protein
MLAEGEFELAHTGGISCAGDYLDRIGTPPETPRFLDVHLRFGMSKNNFYRVPAQHHRSVTPLTAEADLAMRSLWIVANALITNS